MAKVSPLLALALLAGCETYAWEKIEQIGRVEVVKIETPLAAEFCSALLGSPKIACAVRLRNGDTGRMQCVVVIAPSDADAAAHEGGHCMGYDH